MPPNIFKNARKLVKILPCCKRNGHILFVTFSFLVTVVGQMMKTPPPVKNVFAHLTWYAILILSKLTTLIGCTLAATNMSLIVLFCIRCDKQNGREVILILMVAPKLLGSMARICLL